MQSISMPGTHTLHLVFSLRVELNIVKLAVGLALGAPMVAHATPWPATAHDTQYALCQTVRL